MKKFIFHICLLISVPACTQSSWLLTGSSTTNNLVDITFKSATVGYIVGEKGTILKTVNAGDTWNSVFSDNTQNFKSTSFSNTEIGYALANKHLFKTTDGGANWQNIYTNSADSLNVVYFISDNIGFIGSNKGILKTSDGGQNWVNHATNNEIKSISFPTANTGYFVGGSDVSSVLYKTVDQGVSFFTQNIAMQSVKERVFFINENTGYIIGWYAPLIKKTTDGGQNWTFLSDENGGMDINFINEQEGFYLQDGGGLCKIYSTTTGGDNWTEELSISKPNNSLYGLKKMIVNDGSAFVIGANGMIYKKSVPLDAKTLKKKEKTINVFPNPTNEGSINIEYDKNDFQLNSISLINILGETIEKYDGTCKILNFDHVSEGIYYLKFETADAAITEKILIN